MDPLELPAALAAPSEPAPLAPTAGTAQKAQKAETMRAARLARLSQLPPKKSTLRDWPEGADTEATAPDAAHQAGATPAASAASATQAPHDLTALLQHLPETLPAELPVLDAHALPALTEQAVRELLREGESRNTQLSYASALRYWAAWHQMRYGQAIQLPVAVNAVLQFIVDHAQRSVDGQLKHELPEAIDQALVAAGYKGKLGPMALNTLIHRVAVLSKAHQLQAAHHVDPSAANTDTSVNAAVSAAVTASTPNPCQDGRVRELLKRTRRAYAKRGDLPKKQAALTKDPLFALLDTCDDSVIGLRDRALILFAWASGGRRRSEVTSADVALLTRDGPAAFTYELRVSKTNQGGAEKAENFKPVVGIAGEALDAWLAASGITQGALFRQVRKNGAIGTALSPAAVRDIVRRRAQLAGLGEFSAHSLRSGFVTEALRQHTPIAETMGMTGHKSVTTLLGYSRPDHATAKVSRLLN